MIVEIDSLADSVRFWVPPNPQFARIASSLGGNWDGDCWTFEKAQELEVRELCRHLFGAFQDRRDRHAGRWTKR